MIVTLKLCMPEGDAMRRTFEELMETMKRDNRRVIRAMLNDGQHVADTVGELGLRYDPERHRFDHHRQPIMTLRGVRDMVAERKFSCGDAASYESAVMEEKYSVPTECVAVFQDDDYLHGVFVTCDDVVDPTSNYLAQRRSPIPTPTVPVEGSACIIEDGRVVCVEDDECSVDASGTWHCPSVPGLTGKRVQIGRIERTPSGHTWARTADGAVVPVRRSFSNPTGRFPWR